MFDIVKKSELNNAELLDIYERAIIALCYETIGDNELRDSTEQFYNNCKAELLKRLGEANKAYEIIESCIYSMDNEFDYTSVIGMLLFADRLKLISGEQKKELVRLLEANKNNYKNKTLS